MYLESILYDSAVKTYRKSCDRSNEIFQQPADYRIRDYSCDRLVMTLLNNYGEIANVEFVKGKPKRIS